MFSTITLIVALYILFGYIFVKQCIKYADIDDIETNIFSMYNFCLDDVKNGETIGNLMFLCFFIVWPIVVLIGIFHFILSKNIFKKILISIF